MIKKIKCLFLILLALLPSFPILISADDDNPQPGNSIDVKPHPGVKIKRPRSRSINVVVAPECFYYNGIVTIIAPEDITSISAEVECFDDGQIWTDSIAGNVLLMNVSSESGTYGLLLTLSDGNSYYGEYSIQ